MAASRSSRCLPVVVSGFLTSGALAEEVSRTVGADLKVGPCSIVGWLRVKTKESGTRSGKTSMVRRRSPEFGSLASA